MRFVYTDTTTEEANVHVGRTEVPEPGPGELRVRVAAAAVNPIDVISTQPGTFAQFGFTEVPQRVGLGWDLAGRIDAVGEGVDGFAAGDTVLGLIDAMVVPVGGQAEFTVVSADAVAKLETDTDLVEASTLPANASTALQAVRMTGLGAGRTLLVTGAAGAVGGYLVELAADQGLRVIALASSADEPTVRRFGAAEFVDRAGDWAQQVRAIAPDGVDAVIDPAFVGGPALDLVRHGGSFVTLNPGLLSALGNRPGVQPTAVQVRADRADLTHLVELWRAGRISARVADTMALEDVAEAEDRMSAGGLRGRIVLVP